MTAEDALAVANASKTTTEGELATVRQQLTTANANLQTAQDDLKEANDDLKNAQDDLKEAQGDLQTANDEFATVKKERDDAVRDLARAERTLEGLRAQLTEAQQDAADAEQRRREAEREANRRIEQAEQQTNIALRAPRWITALAGMMEETGITVEHEPRKARKVEPTGNYSTCGSASPGISGFSGISCSRQRGAVGDETLRLYTNIQSPSGKAFWKKYGAMMDDITGSLSLAKSSSTPRTRMVDGSDVTTLSGTFDGVGGTFSCDGDGASCTVTKSTDTLTRNQFTGVAGTWTFKPSSLTTRVTATQDSEYLYFGIWEFQPDNITDTTNLHAFRWIGGGDTNTGDGHTISNFADLEGTARFNGAAIGKYVLRNQVGQDDRIGTFTAKASFTADFDDNELDGRITDFREGGSSLAGWTVYLGSSVSEPATLTATGPTTPLQAHASIGGVTAQGEWAATLHGSDNPGFNDFGGEGEPRCPVTTCPAVDLAGVAGWFDAFSDTTTEANSNAAIAGAFAATP